VRDLLELLDGLLQLELSLAKSLADLELQAQYLSLLELESEDLDALSTSGQLADESLASLDGLLGLATADLSEDLLDGLTTTLDDALGNLLGLASSLLNGSLDLSDQGQVARTLGDSQLELQQFASLSGNLSLTGQNLGNLLGLSGDSLNNTLDNANDLQATTSVSAASTSVVSSVLTSVTTTVTSVTSSNLATTSYGALYNLAETTSSLAGTSGDLASTS